MAISPFDSVLADGLFGDADLGALFSDEAEIAAMIRVEAALARVEAELGVIPAEAEAAIAAALAAIEITPQDLAGGDAGIPVPALVARLRASAGQAGRYIHWGATSQDIMDTGLILRLRDALAILGARLDTVIAELAGQAERHARTAMAARTRSQIATPTTFGLRICAWLAPLLRCRERLREVKPRLMVVQFGGASGTLGVLGDKGIAVMTALGDALDLGVNAKAWHGERDTLAELAGWLSLLTGTLGKMGGDLILLGRSEIAEVSAGSGGGSSTMPQKSNPVSAEALVSLARFNAGQVSLMHHALIHTEERDSAAWALEWMALPQMVVATGASLSHAVTLATTLRPDAERMRANFTEAAFAEAAAFALAGYIPLEDAQTLVKQAAKESQGTSMFERLAASTDAPIDWKTFADPDAHNGAAAELVARTVALARSSADTA